MTRRTFFPHLHIHDDHSIKDGCSTVETYADIVQDLGGESLAITNHGQAAGWARQFFACKDRGIKPIFGLEAYMNEHRRKPVKRVIDELTAKKKKKVAGADERLARAKAFRDERFRPNPHMIVLAKNLEGYKNLVAMSTDSWLNGYYYAPRTDTKFLEEHAGGLVLSTACIGGYIPKIARTDYPAAVKEAKRLKAIFGPDFYVELMMTEYDKQRACNKVMRKLAHEIGAPCIVTCDVHYARPKDGLAQDVLLLMRDKKTMADKEAGTENVWQFEAKDLWWRTLEDVLRCWKDHHSDYMDKETILEAIKNTYKLAEEIEAVEFDTGLKLPGVFRNPEGTLRELVVAGLRERLRSPGPWLGKTKRDYAERLATELKVVTAKQFSEYFLIIHDICDHARSIGSRMGPGRGSAGGSLIAYALKITEIDPLRFNLLFERFLDASRSDPPDIDLDFSPEHRDGIKTYVEGRYPATATVGTFGTFKTRAALTDVGKCFGSDYRDMLKITKPLGTDADDKDWPAIFDEWPEVERWCLANPEAFEVVKTLKGLISHRGKHAAAMLVGPASALDMIPMIVEPETKQVVTAFPDTQGDGVRYAGRELTRLGNLKVDILGVANLNIAPGAVEILLRETGIEVDLSVAKLDLEDPLALEVAQSGDVPGVSQLDTTVTRPILRKVGVSSFMDLAMITALCRPGPLRHNVHNTFAKLKNNDAWEKTVPDELVPLLTASRGLMIMQEDVMHVVKVMGGLTPAEANKVRKDVSKKQPELLALWRDRFVEGGVENGYEQEELEEIWDKIETFAGYGFPKAHAVAYMITAYRQIYMLAHHPTFYFASLLASTDRGKKTKRDDQKLTMFMRAAMARGVPVLGPSLLLSGGEFDVQEGSIRFGLAKVKGVKGAAIEVLAARPYSSLEQMFDQVNKRRVNAAVFKALILSGAADDLPFGEAYEGDGWKVEDFACEVEEGVERRNALLARYHQLRKTKGDPDSFTVSVLRQKETELLGMAISWWASPEKEELRESHGLSTIAEAVEEDQSRLALLAVVARAKTHKSKRGTMAFLTLADETGELENFVVWAEQWKHWKDKLKKGRVVVVKLRREENERRSFGRWSYYLDDKCKSKPVESAVVLLRRG